jgi:hypothetical protein
MGQQKKGYNSKQAYPFSLKSKQNTLILCFVKANAGSIMMLSSWKNSFTFNKSGNNIWILRPCPAKAKALRQKLFLFRWWHAHVPCKLLSHGTGLQPCSSQCDAASTRFSPWLFTTTTHSLFRNSCSETTSGQLLGIILCQVINSNLNSQ